MATEVKRRVGRPNKWTPGDIIALQNEAKAKKTSPRQVVLRRGLAYISFIVARRTFRKNGELEKALGRKAYERKLGVTAPK
jgi:hypothetical protein